MTLRYSGPRADYPVYCCRADRDQAAESLCQEVRALAVDDLVSRILLEALAPDHIEIAIAAVDQMTHEVRQLDRQWSPKRERARFDAERARRQYGSDAVLLTLGVIARRSDGLGGDRSFRGRTFGV